MNVSILLLLMTCIQVTFAIIPVNPARRSAEVAYCNQIDYRQGEFVVFSIHGKGKISSFWSYHWLYAISDTEVFNLTKDDNYVFSPDQGVGRVMNLKEKYPPWWSRRKVCKILEVDPDLGPVGNEKSAQLARMLNDKVLPFSWYRCSCQHWIDYVVYGRTFGGKCWPYLKLSDECPLHATFNANTDMTQFQLRSKRKSFRWDGFRTEVANYDRTPRG